MLGTPSLLRDREFHRSWLAFAVAALPGVAGAAWATVRLTPSLAAVDLVEWVLLTAILTVLGSLSQFGIKPGYMQEVSDRGEMQRHAALRTAALAVGVSGALAGLAAALGLYALSTVGLWKNLEVLWWLPLGSALGNLAMIFHTDLRILGRPRVIAMLSVVGLPVSIVALEAGLRAGLAPLAALWASGCLVNTIFVDVLARQSGVLAQRGIDAIFLRRALRMGAPVMGGLLARYVADLAVAATFRWWADEETARLYGLAMRAVEPFFALVIGSFQMAWGAHVYGWLRDRSDGSLAAARASSAWSLGVAGIPTGFVIALAMLWFAGAGESIAAALFFVCMVLSRALAFGLASPMGFGQTLQRRYHAGLRITLAEMILSLAMLPVLSWVIGPGAALLAAGLLPWFSVWWLRRHSWQVLASAAG